MCIHSYFLSQNHPRQIRPEPKQKLCPTDPSESVLVEIARGGGGGENVTKHVATLQGLKRVPVVIGVVGHTRVKFAQF